MAIVTIIGAGSVGLGTAALLALNGHDIRLFSRSVPRSVVDFVIGAEGKVEWSGVVKASSSLEAIVADAELVILCVPANAQKEAIDALVPHLTSGQTVLISAQYSMSALYLSKTINARKMADVSIAALSTTFVTGRRKDPHTVWVTTIRRGIVYASYAAPDADLKVAELLRSLSGQVLQKVSMIEIIFSNPNPVAHVPNALCNLTRIENGEDWSNWGMMTGSVCALVGNLDNERLATARYFGSEPKSFARHLHDSFGNTMGSIHEMCMQNAAARGGLKGPASLSARYITEDVPYGLLPVALLSELTGNKAGTHEAMISLLSIACSQDFVRENNILPELQLKDMPLPEFRRKMRDGWSTDHNAAIPVQR